MRRKRLDAQLSVGIALIVLISIALISLIANLLISRQFEHYVAGKQHDFSEEIAAALSPHYNRDNDTWNLDYIHGFGMYALKDGYMITVYDKDKNVVWDAKNHDMALCDETMQQIRGRMEEKRPDLKGGFVTYRYDLKQQEMLVGYLDVNYYSPYYFNENDFQFLASLNRILFWIGSISVLGAAIVGVIMAKRFTLPITRITEIAREISEGNYTARFESHVQTQELAELRDAINDMAENLEAQESIRRRLTADVAHELRTPIANVSSYLEAMIEGVWEPTEERLHNCYQELKRIADIICDLENLSRMEAENLDFEKECVDLLELACAVQTAFEPELQKKRLTCTVTGESAVLLGNQKRLHQMIFNLLSNAVKYSMEGGHIESRVANEGEMVTFTVEDQGIGIAEKDLPLIFERFYRTDKSRNRKTGGSGIGLAIVKAVVQAHQGSIKVESQEGHGSRFAVTLPKK